MTVTAVPPARQLMPNGSYFHSPLGVFGYQADCVVDVIAHRNRIGIVDTGLGKTIITMVVAAKLYEEDQIDLVMHIGRKAKSVDRDEFPADWARFTSLRTLVYHGQNRHKKLAQEGIPDVLLTTYETAAAELMTRFKKDTTKSGKGSRRDGPLFQTLGLRDKRILWVFDEVDWLRGRGAERYQAYYYALEHLRRGTHQQYVLGLTATAISTDDDGAFNLARLIVPGSMPKVTDYENYFTRGRDDHGNYIFRRDRQDDFDRLWQACIFRKSEDDPEVQRQLPKLLVRTRHVDLLPEHRALYNAVGELYGDPKALTIEQQGAVALALKLTVGHPASHLHANNKLSRAIVSTLGEQALRAIPSSKSRWLIDELRMLVTGQGAQVIVFTEYANTVLPELARDLREAGYAVATYAGEQSTEDNREAKSAFKEGRARVLLSSDAGARGLNLPEASYVIEYEPASEVDVRQQRFGRHRRAVGGEAERPVHAWTVVARKSVDVGSLETVLDRLERQRRLYGDKRAATLPERTP